MLITFSVGNFLSFKNIQTLDMVPDSLKEHKENLHIPYLYDIEARLLKSVGIYGHNSHGKSNFLKAYKFFKDFVFGSFTFGKTDYFIPVENFKLNTTSQNEPSHFEITFYIREIKYRYGFKVTTEKVIEEWLFYSQAKVRENYLFVKSSDGIKVSKIWNKESDNRIEQALPFTKQHHLLLSVLISQENIPRVEAIANWLKGNIVISDINNSEHLKEAVLILAQSKYRGIINKFIENADLGFITIIEKIDSHTRNKLSLERDFLHLLFAKELESFELYTKHEIYDDARKLVDTIMFELLKSESSGTIKYLIIASYLAFAIKQGQLIWVDELDSKFHVLLLQLLIKIYHDPKINTAGSQMIFTTHNTTILGKKLLRRDQTVAIEKDNFGESELRRMHNSENPIRIDASIEKEYLKGSFRGVSKKLKDDSSQPSLEFGI